ncbi:MAG: hypothetical protein Tsb009_36920 [Planctomycetaceae bacterium]
MRLQKNFSISIVLFSVVMLQELQPAVAEDSKWVGKQFMNKHGAKHMRDNRTVPLEYVPPIFQVSKVDGNRLWTGHTWVEKQHVVLMKNAAEYYTGFIKKHPNNAWAYTQRGVARFENKYLKMAIKDFTKSIELKPRQTNAYLFRAHLWSLTKKSDKAIEDYTKVIQLDPDNLHALYNRGNIWASMRVYDKAIKDFSTAIHLSSNYPEFFVNRGIVWGKKGKLTKAIKDFNEALRVNPNSATAYYNLGKTWYLQEKYDKAIKYLSKAIELKPDYVDAFGMRGVSFNKKGDYAKAINDYNKAINLAPEKFHSFGNRAWLRATCPDPKIRDGKLAIADATKACQLSNWKNHTAFGILAAAYAEAGQFKDAVIWQTKALKLAPKSELIKYKSRLKLYRSNQPYREK